MTTKADLMASIERVNQALQDHAKVVGAMPDDGVQQPVDNPVSVQTDGTAKQFSVKSATVDTIKWVLANGTSGRWYGPISALPVTATFSKPVAPPYAAVGDYVLVMWGGKDGMEKSMKLPPYAPTVTAPPTTPIPPTTPPSTATADRFRFVETMVVGTNQERLNMVGMMFGGVSVRRDRGYYDYLTGIGTDHDRYFSPVNFTMDRGCGVGIPGMWAFDQLLDCAQQSILAGRKAIVSPLDVMDKPEYANWDSIKTWFTACAKRVAERAMDPKWFAFELANEWATDDMGLFNKLNQELYKIARGILPNHRLVVGGPEWNGWKRFDGTWQVPPDGDYIIQFHHYEALSVAQWRNILGTLSAFGKKYGVPFINGEVNLDFKHMSQKDHASLWAGNFVNYASAGFRIPMNPWAFIGGKNDFRLNVSGTDPRAIPMMEETFKQCRTLLTT